MILCPLTHGPVVDAGGQASYEALAHLRQRLLLGPRRQLHAAETAEGVQVTLGTEVLHRRHLGDQAHLEQEGGSVELGLV